MAPDAELNKLVTLFERGQYDQVLRFGQMLGARFPGDATIQNVLGAAFGELGQDEQAVTCFRQAVQIDPEDPEVHYNLAELLPGLGQHGEALTCLMRAIDLAPGQDDYWHSLAELVQTITFNAYDETFAALFLRLLKRQNICEPAHIIRPVIRLLKCHETVIRAAARTDQPDAESLALDVLAELSAIELLSAVIRVCVIPDPDLERILRAARAGLLEHCKADDITSVTPEFRVSLALNCHLNEFVWFETASETKRVEQLEHELEQGNRLFSAVAALASYRPLHTYAWRSEIQHIANCTEIYQTHVAAAETEAEIKRALPALGQIANRVSQAVQEQYEENPYPRWVTLAATNMPLSVSDYLQAIGIAPSLINQGASAAPEVLIAGCGTGKQAIDTATRFANARVLAIDLSRSSLAYAMRKTKELGISNIEYLHADILDLDKLHRQFDVIESVGVLHHMDQPMQGWSVLTDRLKPGGVMKIALYSALARREIVAAREAISKLGLSGERDDIRTFRQQLMTGGLRAHKDLTRLTKLADFYTTSECRDMLFHVQEHCFSLPEIQRSLRALNLNFLGFELPLALMRSAKAQKLPPQGSLECLEKWDEFETQNPDTFLRMYQFWAGKDA